MRLHRRDLVVWSPSGALADRCGEAQRNQHACTARICRCIRIGALLLVIAVRPGWRPLLWSGGACGYGVMQGNCAAGIGLIPGFLLRWHAVMIPADSDADGRRRSQLERELVGYSTPAQRLDLEATLDRYSDSITFEMRDIFARQARAGHDSRVPGGGYR
jgi:hypothetical protein